MMPTRACKYSLNKECGRDNPPTDRDCSNCVGHNFVDAKEGLQMILTGGGNNWANHDKKDVCNCSNDLVSHPSHYVEGRKYEPKDVIRDWALNYNLGCVVKYVSRAGRKDDILQDLKKARQYLDFEIEALEAE